MIKSIILNCESDSLRFLAILVFSDIDVFNHKLSLLIKFQCLEFTNNTVILWLHCYITRLFCSYKMSNSVPNEITDNTLSLSTATGLSLFYRTALSCFNICDNNFIFINLDINEPIHHGCAIAILEKNILRYNLKFPWHQLIGKTLLPILILSLHTSSGSNLFLQKYFVIFSISATTIIFFNQHIH
jgi:hypothetical protein